MGKLVPGVLKDLYQEKSGDLSVSRGGCVSVLTCKQLQADMEEIPFPGLNNDAY